MVRKSQYVLAGGIALLVLALLNLPEGAASRLKLVIGGLFLPLFGLAGAAHSGADKAATAATPNSVLAAQNERLLRENQALKVQQLEHNDLARENAQLRQQLGWRARTPWKLKLARVIARDPSNWWRTMRIDLGSRDGMATNLPVLAMEGLVGRIASVGFTQSEVVLLGDPNCRVSAVVLESRDNGIISPGPSAIADQEIVYLSYLPGSSTAANGNTVVASGLGGVYPRGLPIGKIVDKRSVGFGLYLEAQVKLNVNLNHLEEVWVLLP